jgi:hypothetical protein
MPHYLRALIAMTMISFGVARMASLIFWIFDARGRIERDSRALRLGNHYGALGIGIPGRPGRSWSQAAARRGRDSTMVPSALAGLPSAS